MSTEDRLRLVVEAQTAQATQALRGVSREVDRAGAAAKRTAGAYQDAAGRWRTANGQLVAGSKQAGAGLRRVGEESTTAGRHVQRSARTFSAARQEMLSLAKSAAALGAAYASWSYVKSSIQTTDELTKATLRLSKTLGMSVQEASRWAGLAKARDIDARQLTQSFGTFSKQVEGLNAGTKASAETFKALGLAQRDLRDKPFEQQLELVAQKISELPPGTQRAATAMKLFGRGWQTLNPLLNDGARGIRENLRLADKYGVTLDGHAVKSTSEFIKAQREAKYASLGLQLALARTLEPALLDITKTGTRWVDSVRRHWPEIERVVKPIARDVGGIARTIGDFVQHNPKVAEQAVKWGLIAAAVTKISRATGLGSVLKTLLGQLGGGGLGRGGGGLLGRVASQEKPVPVWVMNPSGAPGSPTAPTPNRKPTEPSKTPRVVPTIASYGAAAAATAFAAASNQSQAVTGRLGGSQVVGDGAPAGNQGLTKLLREKVSAVLGVQKVKPLDATQFTRSLREMEQATAKTRRKIEAELEDRLPGVSEHVAASWKKLSSSSNHSFAAISSTVSRNMKTIRSRLGTDSSAGKDAIARNFLAAEEAIQRNMDRGVTSTAAGMRQIKSLLAQALQEFGFTPQQAGRYMRGQDPLTGKDNSAGNVRPGGYADGGWIGAPGQIGRDTVPAMLGVGEAVLNRHQQALVEPAMRMTYGFGLDGLFQRVTTPHYYASGGHITAPRMRSGLGVVTKVGQTALDRDTTAANAVIDKIKDAVLDGPAGTMDGHRVAGWILHILRQARADGVQFTVSDGIRDLAGQWRAYRNHGGEAGVRAGIVARPGTSNHGGTRYPSGAVDIGSGWEALDAWLRAHHSKLHHYGNPLDPYHFSARGNARGGFIRRYAGGGWVKVGATRYDDAPPGAGNLNASGYHYAELGTATRGGAGTGRGWIAKALGMSGELPMGFKLRVRANGKTITADKQDRGYGQGGNGTDSDSHYAIDLWRGAASTLGVSRQDVQIRRVGSGGNDDSGDANAATKKEKERAAANREWAKKDREFEDSWQTEYRRQVTRSNELLRIAKEAIRHLQEVIAQRTEKNGKVHEGQHQAVRRATARLGLWKRREAFAKRRVSAQRRTNQQLSATERLHTNSSALFQGLVSKYTAEQLADDSTDTPLDDMATATAAHKAFSLWDASLERVFRGGGLDDEGVSLWNDVRGESKSWASRMALVAPAVEAWNQGTDAWAAFKKRTGWGTDNYDPGAQAQEDQPATPTPDQQLQSEQLSTINQNLRRQNQILTAQLGVLSQIGPLAGMRMVGSFARGGVIPQTGLAMVHRDELIVPDPQGPFGSSAGGGAAPQVTLHVHGDAGPLIRQVTAVVDGRAAQVVSRELGRRQRIIQSAPGRG